MALSTFTFEVDLAEVVGAMPVRKAWLDIAMLEGRGHVDFDGADGVRVFGSYELPKNATTFSITLPRTNNPGANPIDFTYKATLRVRPEGHSSERVLAAAVFKAPIGGPATIYYSDKTDPTFFPPPTPTVAEMVEADRAAVAADRAAVEAIGNTTDTMFASRINDPASATRGALTETMIPRGHVEHVDGSTPLLELTSDGATAALLHLTAGPNVVAPAYLVGIGNDFGSQPGVVVANKAQGKGLVVHQQGTIGDPNAVGLYVHQQSTLAPGVLIEQNVPGAATGLIVQVANTGAAATPSPGQRLAQFSRANNVLSGYVSAYDGTFRWIDPARFDSTVTANSGSGTGDPAKFVATDSRALPAILEMGAIYSGGNVNDGAWTAYRPAGSTTHYGWQMLATNGEFRIQSAAAAVIGSHAFTPLIRIGSAATLGFFGVAPVGRRAAIASPTADSASLKTAVDAIRVALTTLGLTA